MERIVLAGLILLSALYLRPDFELNLSLSGPAFLAVGCLACMLGLPSTALCLSAGALYPGWRGTLLASATLTLSAALAFLVGRYFLAGWLGRGNQLLAAILKAIDQEGWKMVLCLRLTPVIPFALGNYGYGLSRLNFWVYLGVSWLAMLPGTTVLVGTGGGNWTMTAVGAVFSLVGLAWARKKVRAHLPPDWRPGPPRALRVLAFALVLASVLKWLL